MSRKPEGNLAANAAELLRRVTALPDPQRWQYRDVCPVDGTRFTQALGQLVEWGYVERVVEPRCRWHYRLTPKGRRAASGEERLSFGDGIAYPVRVYEATKLSLDHRASRQGEPRD